MREIVFDSECRTLRRETRAKAMADLQTAACGDCVGSRMIDCPHRPPTAYNKQY